MTINRLTVAGTLALGGLVGNLGGCSNDFGQPCDLPQTEEFRRACQSAPPEEGEVNENQVVRETKASCAVKNFAGCATRVCLVYRGSDSFCSEPCVKSSDCEGSADCRPILGDTSLGSLEDICQRTECYCVRAGDLEN